MKCSGNKSKRPVRAAVYTRTGAVAGDADEGLSQDVQLAHCVRWGDDSYGAGAYQLHLFTDSGFSANLPWGPGPKSRCRPALSRLVAALNGGQVDVVVVRTLNRLSRSAMLHHRFVEEVLKPHGIALVVTEGNIAPPVV
jgi:hypothetical protein